jgi:hypothetical protein
VTEKPETVEPEVIKNPFALQQQPQEPRAASISRMEAEGPPNVPKDIVMETMAQTDAMIKRVMKCTSPDDPNVKEVHIMLLLQSGYHIDGWVIQ